MSLYLRSSIPLQFNLYHQLYQGRIYTGTSHEVRDFAQNPMEKHTVANPVSIYVPGHIMLSNIFTHGAMPKIADI